MVPQPFVQNDLDLGNKLYRKVLCKVEQYKIYLAETELQKSGEHSILTGTVNTELLWRGRVEHVPLRYDQHLMDP